MGVVFLLYVLVNFWKEGKRATYHDGRSYMSSFLYSTRPEVYINTRPLTVETDRPIEHPVIRFHTQEGRPQKKQVAWNSVGGAKRIPVRRFPSR
jgi:hypothetical protein